MITKNNFCFEQDRLLIENYDEAINSDELYALHHRLETHFSNGDTRPRNCHLSKDELIALNKGKTDWMSEEGRKRISKATSERMKGTKRWLGMHWKVVDGKRVWYKEEEC